jgi:hypothetical protein
MKKTPQEIFDYKTKWLTNGGKPVPIHSDMEFEAKQWCKANLQPHEWGFVKYTQMYEDTFWFETLEASQKFEEEFSKWITD